jgi:hypothetical protein
MAAEWFPVDVSLDTKPEVQELVDLTGEPVEVIVFRLLKLWGWVQLNTADGRFRSTPGPVIGTTPLRRGGAEWKGIRLKHTEFAK